MPRPTRLADLSLDPKNANKGTDRGRAVVAASLNAYGAGRSILVDKHGVAIAGNKTLEAAKAAGLEVRIVPTTGEVLVAVQRIDLDLARDSTAKALALADNRATEIGLAWDTDVLRGLQKSGLDLSSLWAKDEFVTFFARAETPVDDARAEATPDLKASTRIQPGDLFQLGAHRLLCGDSTDPKAVASLMNLTTAGLMNTDAPYGVALDALKPKGYFKTLDRRGPIANDDLTDGAALQTFLERAIRAAVPHLVSPERGPAFYLWHPMLTQGTFFAAAAAADILIHRQIVWVKPHLVLTRSGQYHWQHELCFYGWIRGKPCPWYGDKSQVSVWQVGEPTRGREHPTQKPVELFRRPIKNHLGPGEVCYEPFAGSGSQFIAAEELDVACYGLELEPRYCQVVIDRWEAFAERKAERVAGPGLKGRRTRQGKARGSR